MSGHDSIRVGSGAAPDVFCWTGSAPTAGCTGSSRWRPFPPNLWRSTPRFKLKMRTLHHECLSSPSFTMFYECRFWRHVLTCAMTICARTGSWGLRPMSPKLTLQQVQLRFCGLGTGTALSLATPVPCHVPCQPWTASRCSGPGRATSSLKCTHVIHNKYFTCDRTLLFFTILPNAADYD